MEEPDEKTPVSCRGKHLQYKALEPQAVEESSLWTRERIIIVGLNSYNVFMWSVYYTVLVPLLPMYARRYGFSEFHQGIVLACLQLGWFVGLPLVNKAYLKPLTMVYIGSVALVIAPAIVAFHPSFWTLCISRVIEGFGTCLLVVLMTSVMAREIPEEIRGFAFGLRGSIASLGFFFGPLAGHVLYPYGGLRLIMSVLTVMSLVGLVLYILFMQRHWFASYEARIASLEAQGMSLTARFSALLRESLLRWLLCCHFFSWFFLGMIFMVVPQYMTEELALTSTMITVFWLACEASKIFGALAGGCLADNLKPWDVFFGGLSVLHAAQVVLVVIALQSPSAWVFLLSCSFVFVFGTTEDGILGPSFMKLITSLETRLCEIDKRETTRREERFEEILSSLEFITSVAMLLGPLYAGSVYATIGFSMTVMLFAIVSSVANTCSACGTFQLRHAAPIIASKV